MILKIIIHRTYVVVGSTSCYLYTVYLRMYSTYMNSAETHILYNNMESFKVQYNAVVKKMNGLLQPRVAITFWRTPCDPQSICARAARDIVSLVEKRNKTLHQNERIKEEILMIADHEKLLSVFRCNALALLTIKEALIYLVEGKASEESIQFLESIILEVQSKYTSKPTSLYCLDEHNEDHMMPQLNILIPQHVGDGMKYLAELQKIKKVHQLSLTTRRR